MRDCIGVGEDIPYILTIGAVYLNGCHLPCLALVGADWLRVDYTNLVAFLPQVHRKTAPGVHWKVKRDANAVASPLLGFPVNHFYQTNEAALKLTDTTSNYQLLPTKSKERLGPGLLEADQAPAFI